MRWSLFIWMLLNATVCLSQKYAFSHYDIEDGLIQSQVNNLCLDNEHRLWMATYGGASRFDGKEFLSYSRQNGMPGNFVNTVFVDKNDVVWFGTQNGLVKLQNRKLTTLSLPPGLKDNRARNIVQDAKGVIWAIINNKLFKISGNTAQQRWVQDAGDILTCLAVDGSGNLLASVYQKGLYQLVNDKWTKIADYPITDKEFYVVKILTGKTDKQKLYLQTYSSIYTIENGKLTSYESKPISSIRSYLLSFTQDANGNFWIGTTNGAYYLKNHQLTHFIAKNGLTDNAITDVYNDVDNNLWFGSQGNGLYKYEGDHFVTLDKSQGMPDNEVVMAISQDKKGNVIMGIDGGGLMSYNGEKILPIAFTDKNPELKRIVCLLKDRNDILWIGTHNGLWSYDGNAVKDVPELRDYLVNGLTEDNNGTLWGITHGGCFYMEKNHVKQLAGFNKFTSSIIGMGKDSVMVGTDDGVTLVVNKQVVKGFDIKPVRTSDVFCMLKYRNMLIIGTDDRGVFTWDKANGEVKNYSLKDGLNSNAIYSLVTDDRGVIWAGTGRGVNRLIFDARKNSFKVTGNGGARSVILESNQNAALYVKHKIWIGTTRGAIIYNPNSQNAHSAPPHVIIQSARLIPQGPSNDWANSTILTNGIKLSHSQNHLAIWFLGVYMKDPDGVSYSYKLKGLDSAYSPLSKNDGVDYPSLPPGKYTFEVKAIAADGTPSDNTASFSFSITPPFYQTLWFRIAGIAFFILLGIGLQSYRHHTKLKRQWMIEATRREESQKIRQQTAEDFHDELGNKLTRITVLSDILDTKMDQTQTDQKKLLEQIRQNAASLYNGTKDILWALDPRSDNLFEILNHIRDFGNELFLDTPVEFEFNGIDESLNQVKLPMEYSRNIPMIFKELLNNILKHAHATRVILSLCDIQKDELHLTLQDNGCGFEQNGTYKGQGINNIVMRTKRIGGNIKIDSEKGKGTMVDLNIKLNNRNS